MTMAVRRRQKSGRKPARQEPETDQQAKSGLRSRNQSLDASPRGNVKDDDGAELLSMKGTVADDVAL